MIGPNQRAALAALGAARPVIARLDPTRHPEENAADLIEIWNSVETALRSLMGGSTLSGQPLIRELRTRELLSLEQAHALLELLAVRERVQRTEYQPAVSDITVAREAFAALERGLSTDAGAAAGAPTTSTPAPTTPEPAPTQVLASAPVAARPPWPLIAGAIVLLAVVAGAWWYFAGRGGGSSALQQGIAYYNAGQRAQARVAFEAAARAEPTSALPHVYLGRIAREEGDLQTAGDELVRAVKLDTTNALAFRELASFFLVRGQQFSNQRRPDLATQDFDAARRNYVRALQLDRSDRVSQGFLGCALMRLGRAQEGMSWLTRAGTGPWSPCASAPAVGPLPPGALPPGARPVAPPHTP